MNLLGGEKVLYFFFKRCFDILISLIALLLLAPLFATLTVLIKLDSPGPVFYKQARLGKNGIQFWMYKFRSMIVDAENKGAGLFNYENDPRVTRIGNFLRKTSLDELPQLINVLKGDMAIVGPRPPVTYELGDYETLNSRYKKRFSVLPGITGLAQVEGRNNITWDRKVDYDNQYIELIKKLGIFIDLKIIFETVLNVFQKKDIYENKINPDISDEQSAEEAAAEVIRKAHEKENDSF